MKAIGDWSALAKREAREYRGPPWWRLRVHLADLLAAAATRLEPDDRGTTSWIENGRVHVRAVRRPTR